MCLRELKRKKHVYSWTRKNENDYFTIPIAEEWYKEKFIPKKNLYLKKPEWIKLQFHEGLPCLVGHYRNVWQIRPITRKVYDIWLAQMLQERKYDHKLPNR